VIALPGMGGRATSGPAADFLGVHVEALEFEEMFRRVDAWLADKDGPSHHIACLNAYCTTLALEDPRLREIYNASDLAGPDGMPFVLWIRTMLGQPCDRFYGPDVVNQLAARARTAGYSFYLYGGSPESLAGMEAYLGREHPHLQIVGSHSPPFRPLSEAEDRAICDEINRLRPDIVCVGLGTPKQDFWIDDHREKLRGTVMVACGATFDFFGGRVPMAPRFIQRSGFEWLYRLAGRDFKRLWRRYTLMNAVFLWNFGLQLAGRRPGERAAERDPGGAA
jgi:N-acetylglucosaminyldiphosphoundecaprenol N-acetyl-beta-D-mannosaminyltransferase